MNCASCVDGSIDDSTVAVPQYTIYTVGEPLSYLNIPNILTILRIILIPVFVSALIYRRYPLSMFVFIAAGVTDLLDGMIARVRNEQTELGKFLDPLADKFLLVTSFILFAIYGLVPTWMTITVLSRDIIIVIGWLLISLITHKTRIEPTQLGKLANASQMVLLAYILIELNLRELPLPDPAILVYITASITIASGLHYIYRELI
jgi:cardiolipin synthase